MSNTPIRIWTPHSAGRGRDLRIAHHHESGWCELEPGMPMLSEATSARRGRQWVTTYRCAVCGRTVDCVTPM